VSGPLVVPWAPDPSRTWIVSGGDARHEVRRRFDPRAARRLAVARYPEVVSDMVVRTRACRHPERLQHLRRCGHGIEGRRWAGQVVYGTVYLIAVHEHRLAGPRMRCDRDERVDLTAVRSDLLWRCLEAVPTRWGQAARLVGHTVTVLLASRRDPVCPTSPPCLECSSGVPQDWRIFAEAIIAWIWERSRVRCGPCKARLRRTKREQAPLTGSQAVSHAPFGQRFGCP